MRDRDVDLAMLLVEKDALLMDHQLGLALWHAVQGAGLAIPGFAAFGFLQGGLALLGLAGAVGLSAALVLVGVQGATRKRKGFQVKLDELLSDMERLKSGGEP